MTQKEIYKRVREHKKFKELVKKRSGFAWKLSFLIFGLYYAFIMVIAFSPNILSKPISNGVTTIGIPIGLFIILLCFVLTGVYTKRANTEFDDLTNEIKEDMRFNS